MIMGWRRRVAGLLSGRPREEEIQVGPPGPRGVVRPRVGKIMHADGTETPLQFEPVPDDDPEWTSTDGVTFRPLDMEGNRVQLGPHDQLCVDVIAPGQSIAINPSA